MEKSKLSLSRRISVTRNVWRSLNGKKGQTAFIVVSDVKRVEAFMYGKMEDICKTIDGTLDKSEDMEMAFRIVSLMRTLSKTAQTY